MPSSAERIERITAVLDTVPDPEIPELSVIDLGIIRGIEISGRDGVEIKLTPTYSGCPAYDTINRDIAAALDAAGHGPTTITRVMDPPWSTDWLSDRAREILPKIGIAPPAHIGSCAPQPVEFVRSVVPPCPRCGSGKTSLISEFGATACKAMRRCDSCFEPFEHVKPI